MYKYLKISFFSCSDDLQICSSNVLSYTSNTTQIRSRLRIWNLGYSLIRIRKKNSGSTTLVCIMPVMSPHNSTSSRYTALRISRWRRHSWQNHRDTTTAQSETNHLRYSLTPFGFRQTVPLTLKTFKIIQKHMSLLNDKLNPFLLVVKWVAGLAYWQASPCCFKKKKCAYSGTVQTIARNQGQFNRDHVVPW